MSKATVRHNHCFRVRHLLEALCSLSHRWQAPPSSPVATDLEAIKPFPGTHGYRPVLEKYRYRQWLQKKKKRWAPVPSSGRALLFYQKKDVDMQHREAACIWNWPLPL